MHLKLIWYWGYFLPNECINLLIGDIIPVLSKLIAFICEYPPIPLSYYQKIRLH